MEQVTPKYESAPERSYIRDGAIIRCFGIEKDSGGITNRVLTLSASPVFVIELPSDDVAKALMEDLYYGEYTGG